MKHKLPEEEIKEECTIIKKGDIVDLSKLLFTKKRKYLIKYDNQRVTAKQLSGKVIVIYFVSLEDGFYSWEKVTKHLMDIYHKLESKGGFEVVFVAVGDDIPSVYVKSAIYKYTPAEAFEQIFSKMACTAIPFPDQESRNHLERIFGVSSGADLLPRSFVIDPKGLVLQSNATHLFSRYGAEGYPFSDERIKCLDSEDNISRMQLSVKTVLASLLTSPERDYVITNKGDKVPVHTLEDKVVGLYFYAKSWEDKNFTEELMKACEDLSKNMKDFKIVLICAEDWWSGPNEDLFLEEFGTMPWLAVPFKDRVCREKLAHIFKYPDLGGLMPVSMLVIIGPNGEYIEPFGAQILEKYGSAAYPFSRSSAVKLEVGKVKEVKPEMLWDLDDIFRQRNGSQVRFSQLVGKRIIVLVQAYRNLDCTLLMKLREWYIKMKGTDDEFEMIHIHSGWEESVKVFPWLMHPFFCEYSSAGKLIRSILCGGHNGLLAFDRDGRVVRRTTSASVGKDMVFPFYKYGDMENEVLHELNIYICDCLFSDYY